MKQRNKLNKQYFEFFNEGLTVIPILKKLNKKETTVNINHCFVIHCINWKNTHSSHRFTLLMTAIYCDKTFP